MKKILLLIFITLLILLLVSCNNTTHKLESSEKLEEKPIGYKIEKIVLSKGYQTIEPNVELNTKDGKTKLLASLGLVECSGVTIDKITKSDNEINIYTNRLLEDDKTQLVIPQANIVLYDLDNESLKNFKFNIINQNYKPIELKFGKTQTLNKIYSHFKISPNTIPEVNLVRNKDSFVWNISFNNIFDKENLKAPLVNLSVKADALTGEILSSNRNIVSDYIDDGLIIDYVPKKYLLYKQEHSNDSTTSNVLWLYNLETKEKEKIYETNDSIYSAIFNPDNNYISLIENDENETDIYLINMKDKITNKITPIGYNHTWNISWKDNSTLCFMDNNAKDKSTMFSYNIKDNSLENIFTTPKNISNFDINGDLIVFTEFDEGELNQNIYLTKDGTTLKKLDEGYSANFLNDDKILYLKNIHDKNEDNLYSYDLKEALVQKETDLNVKNYVKLNSENLIIIAKNSCNNDYTLVKYNIKDNSFKEFANITGDKLFYDEELNKGYISLSPPIENSKRHIIYSIDLSKLKLNTN
ncbi:TolB family protein [Sporanaerobacter acetigenes]|uniref:TolB protein n=2 Tax=Sporanaerobacter acetigenes DSM 13106 TaxID=1123281 RepID=A0A1M5Z1N5_9FIRM|nr:hypothetical protein [Sporanaerobacter acetigenes]SHI18177.1 hypothetical protein SAMN02745180_02635 [Sporanaerobacter acetigenes DSM 13106]